jgi:cellulose synthase/poly-beta-1,6-N-acetylglucosamine synthase-like glycosyltransferase
MLKAKKRRDNKALLLLSGSAFLSLLVAIVVASFVFPTWLDPFGILKTTRMVALIYLNVIENVISIFAKYILLYIPLAAVGTWRWSVWIFKRICAQRYKPIAVTIPQYYSTLSIITPVFNENPHSFATALNSWQSNNPDELIAVIDYTDKDCIKTFEDFSKNKPWAKLIVTPKPGKRPSLAEGILSAKSDIVALVDSDTIWAPNIKEKLLAPFRDPKIGGVTAKNHPIIERPKRLCIWQRMTDIFWDMRNYQDLPSQTATGRMLTCLSGRTSLYRRKIIVPKLDEFLNEIILGKRKEPGEDKCLTRLIQSQGWKTYYQSNAEVYSFAATDFKTFWSQRVRWTRNSHNSDLLSLWDGWVWKHPYLAFYMVDRFISSFTLFLGPIYFGLSIYTNQWIIALSIFIWWIIGRGIKIIPHLRRKPNDLLIVPLYVAINFLNALIKIYALVTMGDQKWIRGEVRTTTTPTTAVNTTTKARRRKQYFKTITDISLTTGIIINLVILVSIFGK